MGSTSSDTGERPGTRRERTGAIERVVEWIKVDGDRLYLTLGISVGVFVSVLALNAIDVIAFENPDSVTRMASGMIAGTFSLVTLVVSINQLILSQEFSPAGSYRDRLSGVMEFRRDIEERTGVSAAPVNPTQTLSVLAASVGRRADELTEAVAEHPDEEYRRHVERYVARLKDDTERIDGRLRRSGNEPFDALSVSVDYDDAWHLSGARALRNDAPESTDDLSAAFENLIETLRLFGVAQEHFKTVYLQRELTRFSQLTIYCGIPSVLSAVAIALLYGDVGGATINVTNLPSVTAVLVTVVLLPLALLAVYILRTATLTRRTAATGPMFSSSLDE